MNNNINQLGQNIVDNTSSKAKLTDKSQNTLFWLGGFVEGEGSNGVSVAVNRSFKYGINLQPMFSVTQHVRGIAILNAFKEVLGCGSVVAKCDLNAEAQRRCQDPSCCLAKSLRIRAKLSEVFKVNPSGK